MLLVSSLLLFFLHNDCWESARAVTYRDLIVEPANEQTNINELIAINILEYVLIPLDRPGLKPKFKEQNWPPVAFSLFSTNGQCIFLCWRCAVGMLANPRI